jgi:predicted GIY-YIG superfamily endonuclease
MKQYHVYELFDQEDTIVYVGMSINPKNRLYDHVKRKPTQSGRGLFYNRLDLCIRTISSHNIKADALAIEGARKLELGMEWGEIEVGRKVGKTGKGGKIIGNKLYTCQHCNLTSNGVGYHRWHGPNCKKNSYDT